MKTGIFLVSFISGLAIFLLTLASLATASFRFWPPPGKQSWQYRTFWTLFRILVAGVVLLSVLDFDRSDDLDPVWRFYIGLPLGVVGFFLAFYLTGYLGWKNAHGEKEGLKTGGWYGWSRNPIYLVSMIGLVGVGLTVNSPFVYALLLVWGLIYLAAPFVEETWLEEEYGAAFIAYKSRVPRFLGFRRQRV